MIAQDIIEKIVSRIQGNRKITFLVGAGLSSESGIPTFRDKDGYWTKGSENYTPEEMGTLKMFNKNAYNVWNWYLNRIQITKNAQPNAGHFALADIQKLLKNRFSLISQNVDGLHFKSGIDAKDLYLIHGDLRFMRCSEGCSDVLMPIPEQLIERGVQKALIFEEIALITCPHCGDIYRPHVLWFDEYYDEKFYKLRTVQRIAKETGLLFIVGTSNTTTLPQVIFELALANSSIIIDINPNKNELTEKILASKNGFWIQAKSGDILPFLFQEIQKVL